MIIYKETKIGFSHDIIKGDLEERLCHTIHEKMGRKPDDTEKRTWRDSLLVMNNILNDENIPKDSGIAVEYNIPNTNKRVDVIITGLDERENPVAVIVELKAWESAEKVDGEDGVVRTYIKGGIKEMTHPSYQAWTYAMSIEDFNLNVQERQIQLGPCAFLHNYVLKDDNDPITDPCYKEYLDLAPVFTRRDQTELRKFIKKFIRYGDDMETLYLIDDGKLRPSKSLQDSIVKMIDGNEEFRMLDEQKVVHEKIMRISREAKDDGKKRVLIVKGGPGTGKSVLAVNALAKLTANGLAAVYATKNRAPRFVYNANLKNTRKPRNVDNLFRSAGAFGMARTNTFDIILVDEAHRLIGRGYNQRDDQIKELINAAKFTVFFLDESQRVTVSDVGTKENILRYAEEFGAIIEEEEELESQFRCGGSDGYISWLEDVLHMGGTANFDGVDNFSYDIRIFKDPNALFEAIKEKNSVKNRSRLVAGYCWNWITEGKNKSDVHDIVISEFNFGMSWNLGSTNTWAIDPGSVKEIGCVHTCQGLEFDYVGVIIGDDLRYENGEVITDQSKRARTDFSLKGAGSKYPDPKEAARFVDRIIRNTYKTLMTRGMEGCYIYCTDKPLERYLEKRIEMFRRNV